VPAHELTFFVSGLRAAFAANPLEATLTKMPHFAALFTVLSGFKINTYKTASKQST
jgi:hypothetical protein